MFWDFKGSNATDIEMEKQMFGKQMLAGYRRDNGTQRGILADFDRFLSVYHTQFIL